MEKFKKVLLKVFLFVADYWKPILSIIFIVSVMVCVYTLINSPEVKEQVEAQQVEDQKIAEQKEAFTGNWMEEIIYDDKPGIRFFRDTSTDVMYVVYKYGYAGGLTVLLDADGTPLLYSEWLELQED